LYHRQPSWLHFLKTLERVANDFRPKAQPSVLRDCHHDYAKRRNVLLMAAVFYRAVGWHYRNAVVVLY